MIGSARAPSIEQKMTSMTAAKANRPTMTGDVPRVVVAAPGQRQQQRHHRQHQRRRAEEVDAPLADDRADVRERRTSSTRQRDQADRQVDVEDPAPAQVVGQVAAQQRPDDAGQAEDAAEDALDAAALGGREDLRDDREDRRGQDAAGQRPAGRGRR